MENDREIDQSSEIVKDFKTVVDHFYNEDRPTRELQIRYWKELKYYWNGLSQIFWSENDGRYITTTEGVSSGGGGDLNQQAYYDRPVNVFKAWLETIIAALSINVPSVSCVPDDADNPTDISTAKAGNIISQQIYKHNDVILLWLQALYVYCTEGLVACYTRAESSEEYGTYEEDKYKKETIQAYQCPSCGIELDEELLIAAKITRDAVTNKFDPDDGDNLITDLNSAEPESEIVCPQCKTLVDPNLQKSPLVIERFDGKTTKPKSRICMEVYGGLYVKIANYAKKQKDTPYLLWMYETHYVNELKNYPWLKSFIPTGNNASSYQDWEQYARTSTQYRGTEPEENVSVRHCWLRPQAFYILPIDKCNEYLKLYPNGVKVVMINEIVAEYCAEKLDDHWTLRYEPLSDFLNHEPLGKVLTNIQDIVNDLISLTLQTIEHGIAQTWVDPAVVNVNQYGQVEAQPGNITATKTVGGAKKIGDAFFTAQTAALSPEVFSFYGIVNQLGQFVSGALPALYGGATDVGDTASAYAMSKDQALQRLATPWKGFTIWWKGIFAKAIPAYMKIMVEDERVVQKDEQGNYVNVFIRKSELQGKIGDIELETGEQLPISEEQERKIILELMQLNNMEIFAALTSPENLPYIRKIVRIPQFRMPGEDDRTKQYEEITELLNSVPIPLPVDEMATFTAAITGQPPPPTEVPSVEIDPLIDNHKIESDICRSWAISEAGRLAKKENPEGYKNVLLHMQMHQMELQKQQAQMMQQQALMDSVNGGEEKGKSPVGQKQKGPEKIKGSSDGKRPIQ